VLHKLHQIATCRTAAAC